MPARDVSGTLAAVRIFVYILIAFSLIRPAAGESVQAFRLDQDRLWLEADGVPLSGLLTLFSSAGIDVQMDPGAQKTVSGVWRNADVERVLDTVLAPHDYLLDWRRENGPLGERVRLTGIRVFREGFAGSVQPLRPPRRIETAVDGTTRFLARELLVGFGPTADTADLQALLARIGGTIIDVNRDLGVYRILLPPGANVPDLAAQLAADDRISLAEPNLIYDLPELMPAGGAGPVPAAGGSVPETDDPVAVAVLDSGLALDGVPDAAVLEAFDATNPEAPLTTDAVGHGTLMARIAAGLIDPYQESVGEGVPVIAVKAFADDGSADAFTLMNAVTHAVGRGRGPLSLSWGSETDGRFMERAVQYALSSGRLVVAAVGNENTGRPVYPAAYEGVIGVAASDGKELAGYSNRGGFVDIAAPGSAGGSQGTSIATAYVGHIAALYMRHNPQASAAETARALYEAAGADGLLSREAVKRMLMH